MDTAGPLWSARAAIDHHTLLESIHREYIQNGAEIITTATFRTTRRAFAAAGEPDEQWRKAARKAVEIASQAAGNRALVAGSIAPLEDCFRPELSPGVDTARKEHLLLSTELVDAGIDVLWLETFGTLREISAALDAARQATQHRSVPFVISVTTNSRGSLISDETLGEAFDLAHAKGASAFAINCIPIPHVWPALFALTENRMKQLPIGVYPNLGFADTSQDWEGSAYLTPEEFATNARKWIEAGVRIVGGCCGSTPAHIRALRDSLGLRTSRF